MAKVDLHVHSRYSTHPSNWFLQRIGASESYTEPEYIYKTAIERGMDFVTLTDHNRIEGSILLRERYPDRTFTGVESTAYFPEDRCKIHVLIYGLNESQFSEIERLRTDIYELRDYLHEQDLAHSVAHATYSINGVLSVEVIEKLALLFNTFEGLNGARIMMHNRTLMAAMKNLTPELIQDFRSRHNIEPVGKEPWIKGFTGGSDDHAGLFIARTWTSAPASTPEAFLQAVKSGTTTPEGRHNNYQSLAFSVYKIAYDYSQSKGDGLTRSFLTQITESVYNHHSMSFRDQVVLRYLKTTRQYRESRIKRLSLELMEQLQQEEHNDIEKKLDLVYDKIGEITDEFFRIITSSLVKNMGRGNLEGLIKGVSSSLLGIFMSVPFFSTLKIMYDGRPLLSSVKERFNLNKTSSGKKILWFTDTYTDLNGVASTVREIGALSEKFGKDIYIVTSLPTSDSGGLHSRIINLPAFHQFALPSYETITLRLPSMLRSIKLLYEIEPDEIFISTPGPVGLLGLLLSRLMNSRSTGIYHTDFSMQALNITGDDRVFRVMESFMHWFYSCTDEVMVPTGEYMDILEDRGFDRSRMKIFRRAIDGTMFSPEESADQSACRHIPKNDDAFILLYTGRISRDKNIDFLISIFREVRDSGRMAKLVIAGDGPDFSELKKNMSGDKDIILTGRLAREELPVLYSSADLFVFPSVTDTFGMVVLEAQACGLPAVVSGTGGPREIIKEGVTGSITESMDLNSWVDEINSYIDMKENKPEKYRSMRIQSRLNGLRYDWDAVFTDLTGEPLRNKSTEKDISKMVASA